MKGEISNEISEEEIKCNSESYQVHFIIRKYN